MPIRMKDPLVRFGVAIEGSLLRELDALVEERGCSRSELLRDLSRAEVGRAKVRKGSEAVATLTLVYDHHVRDLSEKLTELQHQLGDDVRAALHVHLSHDLCLEVIVMRGRSDLLQRAADRIFAMRGVKHGGIEIVSTSGAGGPLSHHHGHPHLSEDETGPSNASGPGRDAPHEPPERTGSRGSPPAPPRRGRSRRG